ncbi:MAG: hypothetical protein HY554_10405 [Elusimicrobia bacterium]|nr:hypothetical protein [Elusimicrobiota bacterium]
MVRRLSIAVVALAAGLSGWPAFGLTKAFVAPVGRGIPAVNLGQGLGLSAPLGTPSVSPLGLGLNSLAPAALALPGAELSGQAALAPASLAAPALAAPVNAAALAVPAAMKDVAAANATLGQAALRLSADQSSLEQGANAFHQVYDRVGLDAPSHPQVSAAGWYRDPNYNERARIDETIRRAYNESPTFANLYNEFQRKGGRFAMDDNGSADYWAAARGADWQPQIVLTRDMFWRRNYNSDPGAPWQFIASMIAREMVHSNSWIADIPPSAERIAIAFASMARVFSELTFDARSQTGGRTWSWATDKDYKAADGSVVQWGWYEAMVNAGRAVLANTHFNGTDFFQKWVYWAAERWSSDPAYHYSLWEQHSRKQWRTDGRNDQPVPANVPAIDQATFQRASDKVFGNDGKGGGASDSILEWFLGWLRGNREI